MPKALKVGFAVMSRTAILRWARLRRFVFGAGDPQPSSYEQRKLKPLQEAWSREFDKFQKEVVETSNEEETFATRVAAAADRLGNQLAIRLTGAGSRAPNRRQVGRHPCRCNGRF